MTATVTHGWAALGVAASEITSEVLTSGGSAFPCHAHDVPITLAAELLATRDGHRVWHEITFVPIDRKAVNKLAKNERLRKEVQLDLTLTKAERGWSPASARRPSTTTEGDLNHEGRDGHQEQPGHQGTTNGRRMATPASPGTTPQPLDLARGIVAVSAPTRRDTPNNGAPPFPWRTRRRSARGRE